jgi:hypothetical protein
VKPFEYDGWHHTSFYGRIELDKLFLPMSQFFGIKGKSCTIGWHHITFGRDGNT